MPDNFLEYMRSTLAKQLPRDFDLVQERGGAGFGDVLVVLQSGELRLRVIRDRGQVFAEMGSTAEPDSWFDIALIKQIVGDTTPFGRAEHADQTIEHIAKFVREHCDRLRSLFVHTRYPETKRELERLQRQSALQRFGVSAPQPDSSE